MDYNRVFEYFRNEILKVFKGDVLPDFSSKNYIAVTKSFFDLVPPMVKQQILILETVLPPDPNKKYNYMSKRVGSVPDETSPSFEEYAGAIKEYFFEASEEDKIELFTVLEGLREYLDKRTKFCEVPYSEPAGFS